MFEASLKPRRGLFFPKMLALLACACLACLTLAGPGWADAKADQNVIFILDASGSMAAKVQAKAKMAVAKEVLSELIKDLPAGVNVGLTAYGHRDKKDCNDVEELAPLGPPNKQELLEKIKAIQPKGMTPITHSIDIVAEALKSQNQEATIVLVSDGEETCGGDPCAVVRQLKASGLRFTMHVVGFDVNDKAKAQLSCMAQAGGGIYATAQNTAELKAATQKALAKTEQAAGRLKVKALRNGKPFSAYCKVFKAGTGEDRHQQEVTNDWTSLEGVTIKLLPGTYDLVVENQADAGTPPLFFDGLVVEAGKVLEKTADFSGGTLKVKAQRNGKPFSAFCKVFKAGSGEERHQKEVTNDWSREEGASFKLLPGTYDLVVENQADAGTPPLFFDGLVVEAGKVLEKTADFSGGTLKVKAQRNGKPFSAFCKVYQAGSGEERHQKEVTNDWSREEGASFKLLPGTYDLVVENQDDAGTPPLFFDGLVVEAGKVLEKTADFSGGTLKVKAQRNGRPFSAYCKVFKAGSGEERHQKEVTNDWSRDEGATFKLLPGRYDVVVEDQEDAGAPPLFFDGLVVEAGKVLEKIASFSGGALRIVVTRNGKPFSAYCKVFKAGSGEERHQKEVTNDWSRDEGATFKLLPGRYDVVVEDQEKRQKKEFNALVIEADKTNNLQVAF